MNKEEIIAPYIACWKCSSNKNDKITSYLVWKKLGDKFPLYYLYCHHCGMMCIVSTGQYL